MTIGRDIFLFMIFRPFHTATAILITLILFAGCDNSSTGNDDGSGPIPSKNLEAARAYAMDAENSNLKKGPALLIWHDGKLLLEEYAKDFDGQKLHRIWSGSKSFAGILAAIAVREGLFTFDTTLGELIPDWDPESERGKITIRQLLNLTSGIETASIGDFSQTADEWLAADMAHERGSTFTYGPTPFYILSWIFVEVLGENPIRYLNKHLFSPLGVVQGEWSTVDIIYPNLAFGANYPALDWLQIGIMLMNGGSLNGTEIIPEDLMNELLTGSEVKPDYGITFWLNKPGGRLKMAASDMDIPGLSKSQTSERLISDMMPDDLFMMSGFLGQKLYICPSLNLVIVRFGFGNISDETFFSKLMSGVDQTTLQ